MGQGFFNGGAPPEHRISNEKACTPFVRLGLAALGKAFCNAETPPEPVAVPQRPLMK